MARKRSLMSGGAQWAGQSYNGSLGTALTAAGNSQATALQLVDDNNVVTTTAASAGVLVPAMDPTDTVMVANFGANALSVYPPVGGKINNGSTNAAASLPANKGAIITCVDSLTYVMNISA